MKKNGFVLFLQMLACVLLLSSFFLEYYFRVDVCNFCLIQRSLWVFLILVTLFIKNKGVILLIILASMLIAFYQLLMQYGFIVSDACAINTDPYAHVTSCSVKDFLIMYLPLSFYNFIINLVLFIVIIKKMGNQEKEPKNDILFNEENF